MARINIDDSLFGEGGFLGLVSLLKDDDKAYGKVLKAFKTAQGFWLKGELIPESLWKALDLEPLIECHLAERRDTGIYVNGSEKAFDWLLQKQKAGKLSGESRRRKGNGDHALFERSSNVVDESGTTFEQRSNNVSTECEHKGNGSEALSSLLFTHLLHTQDDDKNPPPKRLMQEDIILMFNKICAGQGKIKSFNSFSLPPEATVNFLNRSGHPEWQDREKWENFFKEVIASDFLTGKKEVGFTATLPWILKPDNFENILGGLHGNRDEARKASSSNSVHLGALSDKLFDQIVRNGRYAFQKSDYSPIELKALEIIGGLATIFDCTNFTMEKVKAQLRAAYKQASEELS